LNIIHECEQKQAFVTVLGPYVSTKGDMGQIVMTVLGMVAQMERRFIKERQREGIDRAKSLGRYKGGKPRIDRDEVLRLVEEGEKPSSHCADLGLFADAGLSDPERKFVTASAPSSASRVCGPNLRSFPTK
jgi:DNA invertase Pin-like site-specific DNA recombinase